MRDRYRGREAWRALGALVLAGVILGGSGGARPPGLALTGPASAVAAAEGAVPSCQGARTLLMRRGTQRFPRSAAYDAVCIYGGVLQVASGATLRAGLLYVGADGAISSDGAAGRVPDPGGRCPNGRSGAPQGGAGGTLIMLARRAVVVGRITADGGPGLSTPVQPCANGDVVVDAGNGGDGGAVTLVALTLTLAGTISAGGGAGGTFTSGEVCCATGKNGVAGSPGTVTVHTLSPRAAALRGHIGPARRVTIAALTPAERGGLPPAPAPLLAVLGTAPIYLPLAANDVFSRGMACGPGDLIVARPRTVRLAGRQTFRHVCLAGTVRAGPQLTLVAGTLLLAPSGRLLADGVDAQGPGRPSAGACSHDRRPPPPGRPGVAGAGGFWGAGRILGGRGGPGGGTIVVIAHRLLLAGRLSAQGAPGGAGQDGVPGSPSAGDQPATDGGDGGGGGGLLIVAHEAQVSGIIAVDGGPGGPGGKPVGNEISHDGLAGLPGCAKLFVDRLRTRVPGVLPLADPLLLGRTVPEDPRPPAALTDSL